MSQTIIIITGCGYIIRTIPDNDDKNYVIESSISECSGTETSSAAIWHHAGNIKINNINTSNHQITEYAAYMIEFPTGNAYMSYITTSNTSSSKTAGMLNSYGNFFISYCNYLDNEINGFDSPLIMCSPPCGFSYCSFMRNKGNKIFFDGPFIDHCYFKDNSGYQGNIESGEPLDSAISHYTSFFKVVNFESFVNLISR